MIGWLGVFIRVQNTKLSWNGHAICQFVQCPTISGRHFSFFFLLIEREISEQASGPVATEELNKDL